jgi:hypothetical protein
MRFTQYGMHWRAYLLSIGYPEPQIRVLGCTAASSYDQYDGLSKESNVKAQFDWFTENLKPGDVFFHIFVGHGDGDGNGNSYNECHDSEAGEDNEDGQLWDYEYISILEGICSKGVKVMTFFETCLSGGIPRSQCKSPIKPTYTCRLLVPRQVTVGKRTGTAPGHVRSSKTR